MPFHHPTNIVEALNRTQITDLKPGKTPTVPTLSQSTGWIPFCQLSNAITHLSQQNKNIQGSRKVIHNLTTHVLWPNNTWSPSNIPYKSRLYSHIFSWYITALYTYLYNKNDPPHTRSSEHNDNNILCHNKRTTLPSAIAVMASSRLSDASSSISSVDCTAQTTINSGFSTSSEPCPMSNSLTDCPCHPNIINTQWHYSNK